MYDLLDLKKLNLGDRVTIGEQITWGGFSTIYQGILKDGTHKIQVAIKSLRVQGNATPETKERLQKRFYREIHIWQKLRCPNIAHLLGYTILPNGCPALISPWYINGNVIEYLKCFPNANRRDLAIDVANGLDYLHSVPVAHGDLKGENVLVNSHGRASLCDFGMSQFLDEASRIVGFTTTNAGGGGTDRFMSPEILDDKPKSSATDMWALGCLVVQILTDIIPYEPISSKPAVYTAILRGEPPVANKPGGIEEPLWNCIRMCWSEQQKRPPVGELRDHLTPMGTKTIRQSIYPPLGSFSVKIVNINNCAFALTSILHTSSNLIGVAAAWSADQQDRCPIKRPIKAENWEALQNLLVQDGNPGVTLVAFESMKIALALHQKFRLSMRAADLGNYLQDDRNLRGPLEHIGHVFRNEPIPINIAELSRFVGPDAIGFVDDEGESACYQAWIFLHTATLLQQELVVEDGSNLKLDTRLVSKEHLDCISFIQHQFNLLDVFKTKNMKNDFSQVSEGVSGNYAIRNDRYSTKVRLNRNQVVVLEAEDRTQVHAIATAVQGKTTTINLQNPQDKLTKKIKSIHVIGREDITVSEAEQKKFFLGILQGRHDLDSSVFVRLIWFDRAEDAVVDLDLTSLSLGAADIDIHPFHSPLSALNPSQLEVAQAILAPVPPVIVCHGPPGTGKTRTISAIVKHYNGILGAHGKKETVWICAQSNVGVKNIAEALIKGGVEKFKLVVSKEFHEEWHEHLYGAMESKVVRLDLMPTETSGDEDQVFEDVHIVLCTLGMLSNPMLQKKGVIKKVPVSRLIIDEASQIYIGQYMHLFYQFRSTLHKVALFGDPKQLPPFRGDKIRGLYSVFEVEHLAKHAFFLNTQYRMPEALGNFISRAMYEGRLISQHEIKAIDCVTFVDTPNGVEIRDSNSWKNLSEVQTIVHLVRKYYRNKEFAVITPYEAQRAAIQAQLKRENLPWEQVFTVDSYQGNETEFALISLVRTSKPGFLRSRHRVNVMLTRCKKGMVIVTSRMFLEDHWVKSTLIGEMERYWDQVYKYNITRDSLNSASHWVDWRRIVEGTADMPGSSSKTPFLLPAVGSSTTSLTSPNTLTQHLLPALSNLITKPITLTSLAGPSPCYQPLNSLIFSTVSYQQK